MSHFVWLYKLPSNALTPVLCAYSDALRDLTSTFDNRRS